MVSPQIWRWFERSEKASEASPKKGFERSEKASEAGPKEFPAPASGPYINLYNLRTLYVRT